MYYGDQTPTKRARIIREEDTQVVFQWEPSIEGRFKEPIDRSEYDETYAWLAGIKPQPSTRRKEKEIRKNKVNKPIQ